MMGHQYIPEECLEEAQAYADFYAGRTATYPNLYEKRMSSYGLIIPSAESRRRSESPCGVGCTSSIKDVPSQSLDESFTKPKDDEDLYAYLKRMISYEDSIPFTGHFIDLQSPMIHSPMSSSTFFPITDSLEMCTSAYSDPFPSRTFASLNTTSSTGISEDFRSLGVSPISKSTPRKKRACVLKKSKAIGKRKIQRMVKLISPLP
jgi:hypothetical protein